MSKVSYKKFKEIVKDHYLTHGRHLPWRETFDWYEVLVSEIMLQQTQVDRVLPKYRNFLAAFPRPYDLAAADFKAVLSQWKGLGYNRRAQHLQNAVRAVVQKHDGELPSAYSDLVALPGIGDYTANALMVFVHKEPRVVIETNIRSAYLFHFFAGEYDVHDDDVRAKIAKTIDADNPRDWYYALMDYGVYIKKTFGNPNIKSKHYSRQSRFEGSDRQLRGKVLELLLGRPHEFSRIQEELKEDEARVRTVVATLLKDKLIIEDDGLFSIS